MCREAVFISASAMCNPTAALNNRRGAACDLQMLKGSSVLFGAATLTPSHEEDLYLYIVIPFVSLKKQGETLFQLICCEKKTLFWLKK